MSRTAKQDKLIGEVRDNSFTYMVAGDGKFPIDMLRYDGALPATGADSERIANSAFLVGNKVALRSLKEPTVERWNSYGWAVL